jgi:hypothetical protein
VATNLILDNVPEINAAVARAVAKESKARQNVFLPLAPSICGVPVLPLTVRHLTILYAISSPLVARLPGTLDDCAQFLWIVSPSHVFPTPHIGKREVRAARQAWLKRIWPRIRLRELGAVSKAILRFVEETTFDLEEGRKGRRDDEARPVGHFCASLIDEFAGAYGWPEQVLDARGLPIHAGGILDKPFAMLLQVRRCRARRLGHGVLNHLSDDAEFAATGAYIRKHQAKEAKEEARKQKGAK